MVCALGHISGGHFNPAITIGFWVTKRLNTMDTIAYWVAQLAGATAAAFVLRASHPGGHLARCRSRHAHVRA